MDNTYLQELIFETQARGGGLILSLDSQPAVVVLSVEKYNQLLNGASALDNQGAVAEQEQTQYSMNMDKEKILVTGGAGYIGSHAARQLIAAGYDVVVLDNLSCGKRHNVPEGAKFVEGDLADLGLLRDLFAQENFDTVIHFAASIEVEESVKEPQKYFDNNVLNTAKLLGVMSEYAVRNIIFSSTAAVYGEPEKSPISESFKLAPINPYGYTKLLGERLIKYYCQYLGFSAVVFRYFNACGCDVDGAIEPTHHTHLFSNVMEVVLGKTQQINVFGDDYETFDGTCVRDYVHVLDIAGAHVAAIKHLGQGESYRVFNIGTGKGYSVLEIINKTAEVLNKIIPMQMAERRVGDPPALVADNSKLIQELGFKLKYSDLETIITTSYKQAENFK